MNYIMSQLKTHLAFDICPAQAPALAPPTVPMPGDGGAEPLARGISDVGLGVMLPEKSLSCVLLNAVVTSILLVLRLCGHVCMGSGLTKRSLANGHEPLCARTQRG